MPSIFTQIISGKIPSYTIAENDRFYAFLDIFPLAKGHTLVIPKVEIDKIFDVPDEYLQEWLLFARPIAKAIETTFDCNRCGISVVGLEVPHAHMHLIPINTLSDMDFTQPKLELSTEEFEEIQQKIIHAMP